MELDILGFQGRHSRIVECRPQQMGSGGADPANPHPEGKVPLLVHDGVGRYGESNAIMVYLTDLFPAPGFGDPSGIRIGQLSELVPGTAMSSSRVIIFAAAGLKPIHSRCVTFAEISRGL